MCSKKAIEIINSIFDWPIEDQKIEEVYQNFLELNLQKDDNTLEFLNYIIGLDVEQRKGYRDRLASMGFELRPDEFSQYIVILTIAMEESTKV
jgi:hypothetical protein